jgi:uncharacterized membrane protein HdeD (DUF308 family)
MTDTALLPQKSDIWWIFLLQGFAGIILGLMLVTQPGATIVALTTFLGFYWLITGLLGLVQVFVDRATPWIWSLLSGIVGILAGLFVLRHPLFAALTVPTLIVLILGIQGLVMGVLQITGGFKGGASDLSFSGRSMFWSEFCWSARRSRQRWRCRSCSAHYC